MSDPGPASVENPRGRAQGSHLRRSLQGRGPEPALRTQKQRNCEGLITEHLIIIIIILSLIFWMTHAVLTVGVGVGGCLNFNTSGDCRRVLVPGINIVSEGEVNVRYSPYLWANSLSPWVSVCSPLKSS